MTQKMRVVTFCLFLLTIQEACSQVTLAAWKPVSQAKAGENSRSRLNLVSVRAVRHFKTEFREVPDEEWHVLKKGLAATFGKGSIKTMVVYDRFGNWTYTSQIYPGNKLAENIHDMVRSAYYDYTIRWINEVHKDDMLIYEIHMQDGTSNMVVEVCDGRIRRERSFRRSE